MTCLIFSPSIELTTDWSGRWEGQRPFQGDWANASRLGHKLLFWATIVDRMPDNIVQDLVAHELAHVFQYACGWENGDDGSFVRNDDYMTCGEAEEDADQIMEDWGFSATAMTDWSVSEGISVVRVVSEDEFWAASEKFDSTGRRF